LNKIQIGHVVRDLEAVKDCTREEILEVITNSVYLQDFEPTLWVYEIINQIETSQEMTKWLEIMTEQVRIQNLPNSFLYRLEERHKQIKD
jgi:hypothetical protein